MRNGDNTRKQSGCMPAPLVLKRGTHEVRVMQLPGVHLECGRMGGSSSGTHAVGALWSFINLK